MWVHLDVTRTALNRNHQDCPKVTPACFFHVVFQQTINRQKSLQ